MRKIHSKDTSIELLLRKALWHKGYRYRKNYKVLPGSPDIVLTKYKIAIFCDSEFFHGKDWDSLKTRLEKGKKASFKDFPQSKQEHTDSFKLIIKESHESDDSRYDCDNPADDRDAHDSDGN